MHGMLLLRRAVCCCRLDEFTLMSRCSACNAAAFKRISHKEAAAHVNDRLLELVDAFWQCGK
jgi:uncharacterized protein with PIN domain